MGRTLTLGGFGNTNFNGPIVNGGSGGNSALTITNTGTTTLSGANTYSGATTLSAGTSNYTGSAVTTYGGSLVVGNAGGYASTLNNTTSGTLTFANSTGIVGRPAQAVPR